MEGWVEQEEKILAMYPTMRAELLELPELVQVQFGVAKQGERKSLVPQCR